MESKKALKQKIINEVSLQYKKKYDDKVKSLLAYNNNLHRQYDKIYAENARLQQQVAELREVKAQYEDWIERLLDFCNLPEEERTEAATEFVATVKINKSFSALLSDWGIYNEII